MVEGETTHDRFLGGRLTLRQPRDGHRVGLDAALLSACPPADATGLALDIGAGVGAVGLALAARAPGLAVGLIENDAHLAALARANVAANGMDGRARTFEADLTSPAARRAAGLAAEGADWALTNPPFFDPSRHRVAPGKAGAHAMTRAGPEALDIWIRSCFALLRPGGVLCLIHRADALTAVLAACAARGGDLRVLPVRPREGAAATRVLIRAVKGARAPLTLLPGLALHDAGGAWRPLPDAVLRGAAALDWGV
jgi:tRNA1(Val) A37 N6-methylase TrmN6